MKYERRYDRNQIFSDEEQAMLFEKRVAVIGCGGLGGYVIEMLARSGVGHILACDGDEFTQSNLNRQLTCTEHNLGMNKAAEAKKRIAEVNSEVEVETCEKFLSPEEALEVIRGCDLAVDCLDSIADRKSLQKICKELGIPMVHGAINDWFGQVTTILPGDDSLDDIYYMVDRQRGEEDDETDTRNEIIGNPAFTPAVIAGIEVSEALKTLLGYNEILRRKLMLIDLFSNEIQVVDI